MGRVRCPVTQDRFPEGFYVKIKNCSREVALAIFRGEAVTFLRPMEGLLGSGGAVRGFGERSRQISTPDGRETWSWPLQMLEPLHCPEGHDLQLADVSTIGRCNGCDSAIAPEETTHRCEPCDFDLCEDCAEKQATWFVGQRVKIQRVHVEHARRLQSSGWRRSMQCDLGATKRILDVSVGKCQLEGGRWWMLGLLEARVGADVTYDESQFVKIKHLNTHEARCTFRAEGVSFNPLMERLLGSGGAVHRAGADRCKVFTADRTASWVWPHEMLEPLQCLEGHALPLARQPRVHRCDGCRYYIRAGEQIHRCRDCDFDLCMQCAEKQATWSIGQRVKIRWVPVTQAEAMHGPGWHWSMQDDLGASKRILRFRGGFCQLQDRRQRATWWMLGLLEAEVPWAESPSTDLESDFSTPLSFPSPSTPTWPPGASQQSDKATPELFEGGHEEDWADGQEADRFKCPICLKVCREAVMHSCRKIFCGSCWIVSHAVDERCPVCRDSTKPAQQAYQQQWDIGKLQINCPLKCGETFPLSEKEKLLLKHFKECPRREVICSDCLMQVPAHRLPEHLEGECDARPTCELCGMKVAASALEEHMQTPSKEHMKALVGEVCSLKTKVEGLQEEVRVLQKAKESPT